MAISVAHTAGVLASGTDATSGTTATFTPASAGVLIATAVNSLTAGTPNGVTFSGGGLTWNEQIAGVDVTAQYSLLRISCAWALVTTPASMTVTAATSPSQTAAGWDISVELVTGCDTTTFWRNWSQNGNTVSSAGVTVTLGSFADAANARFGCATRSNNTAITASDTPTELYDAGHTQPATRLETNWLLTNDTTMAVSDSTSTIWAAIAFEIMIPATSGDLVREPLVVPQAVTRASRW